MRGALMVLAALGIAVAVALYVRGQSLGSLASDIVDRDVVVGVFVANAVLKPLLSAKDSGANRGRHQAVINPSARCRLHQTCRIANRDETVAVGP